MDYFNIAKMTEEFRKVKPKSENGPVGGLDDYEIWDLRFKLAIAQQLSVISGSLSKLIDAVEAQVTG